MRDAYHTPSVTLRRAKTKSLSIFQVAGAISGTLIDSPCNPIRERAAKLNFPLLVIDYVTPGKIQFGENLLDR